MSLRQHQGLSSELSASVCLVAAEAEAWSGAQAMSWYPMFRYVDTGCLGAEGTVAIKACGYVAH